ncbi:MAG TPA: 23S rRNA (adenine(2503)-C(2))-methyltransferase RlmN [Pantanalinema sp.]
MAELAGLTTQELKTLAESFGEKPFRGKQIATWLYQKSQTDLAAMSDLPAAFRAKLAEAGHGTGALEVTRVQEATDGTQKFLFDTHGCGMIESVFMPSDGRTSVCISTQIGCAVACAFCETGLSGFQRHLSPAEMVAQVLEIQRRTGERVSHVVFMGMGEPLFNYANTLKALRLLNEEVGIGMRHLTVSTSGVVPGIKQLADEDLQLTLALSLHAPNDALRDFLVPLNRKYPLSVLREAVQDYTERTGRRLTIEYVMLDGVNDTPELARQTADWLRGIHCHVNLIPFNATDAQFRPSSPAAIQAFRSVLEAAGFPVTVRVERGADISAACGQLRRQALKASGEIVPLLKGMKTPEPVAE